LAHVQLVGVGALHDRVAVEGVLELQLAQPIQVALQRFVRKALQRKEERNPGILSGWARTCLSWRTIMDMALP
jgi:hypothetical protein